jgi:hypothetical protein
MMAPAVLAQRLEVRHAAGDPWQFHHPGFCIPMDNLG